MKPTRNSTTDLPLKPHWNFDIHGPLCFLLLLIFILFTPPATAQLPNTLPPPPANKIPRLKFDKSMAIVLVILVVVFFILGFLSVYTRQCAERRLRGRLDLTIPIGGGSHHRRHRGLDRDVIDTFPTFVYSAVKGIKIGRATLECAVCLNEFQGDETLRLIPNCSHVFHAECIDAWLVNHYTCPVCRANLFPRPGENSFVQIQIPDPDGSGYRSESNDPTRHDIAQADGDNGLGTALGTSPSPSPKGNYSVSVTPNLPVRSRSTGFRIANWFPRSHSTGHSLVENYERFTLRLPEEVRNRLVGGTTLSRTTSSGVAFTREGSGRRGYRTRSVGATGRSYEWFNRPDRRGFSWTPPFVRRAGSTRSPNKGFAEPNKVPAVTIDDVGERSSDRLFAGNNLD